MIQQIAAVRRALLYLSFISIFMLGLMVQAQTPVTNNPPYYGPYNAVFLPDGDGLTKSLVKEDTVLQADAPWSLYAWVRMEEQPTAITLVAGVGDPGEEYPRYLAYDGAKLSLWMGKENSLSGAATLATGKWHLIAATFDGSDFHLYSDGAQVAAGKLELGSVSPVLMMAPPMVPPPLPIPESLRSLLPSSAENAGASESATSTWQHFGGKIAGLTLLRNALNAAEIKQLNDKPQDFSLAVFEEGSKPWPVQTRGQAGYRAPQDPATMPRSRAPYPAPVA